MPASVVVNDKMDKNKTKNLTKDLGVLKVLRRVLRLLEADVCVFIQSEVN